MGMYRILFMEDNDDNFELVCFMLQRAGYQVVRALNGRDGLEAARRERPDLILADLSMPEMDGWTAARELKADQKTRHIPIVALTAHALPGDRQRAMQAGCDGYLTKPINMLAFNELIASFLPNPKPGQDQPA